MLPKVVVANWVHPDVLESLQPHAQVVANSTREPWPRALLLERCRDAQALIAFMPERVDEDFLAACPSLRIVACALKGYDNFDVAACTHRGVWLTIVSDLLTAPTSELCIGLMIAVGRNLLPGDALVRSGSFSGWRPQFYGRSIEGSSIGILGAGAIGKAIAKRLTSFSCSTVYVDARSLAAEDEQRLSMRKVSLAELQAHSDFVVLALPLTPETTGLVDAAFLSKLKSGSYLINPARGSLVNEADVAEALRTGHLAGYAADTFACEDWARPDRPDRIDAHLLGDAKTVLTPHLGSAVDAVRKDIALEAAQNVLEYLRGERPSGAINEVTGS